MNSHGLPVMKTNKKTPCAIHTDSAGTIKNIAVPLCFASLLQRKPHKVQTHPCEITVATGKAYTAMLSAHS